MKKRKPPTQHVADPRPSSPAHAVDLRLVAPVFTCIWCGSTAGTEDQGDGWDRCKDCGGN